MLFEKLRVGEMLSGKLKNAIRKIFSSPAALLNASTYGAGAKNVTLPRINISAWSRQPANMTEIIKDSHNVSLSVDANNL